jgi:hypothetical protein
MHWDVVSAKYVDGYRLAVTFADGKSGIVDLERIIRKVRLFRRLTDVNVFKQFRINPDFGVLCWGDDLDIAPETLYEQATKARPLQVAESKARYGTKRKKQ